MCDPGNGPLFTGSWDRTARVWDTRTGKTIQTLEGHTGTVNAVCDLGDGQVLTGSTDNTARVWEHRHPAKPSRRSKGTRHC